MSALPAARSRVVLHQVSAASWEHPADRAALQALRAVPGVDDVIRKLMSVLGGERGIRLLFQGNAVRTGTHQFPTLYALQVEVATTFDWPEVPEVYVSQAPVFNAGTYGVDRPFIVMNTAAVERLTEDELRVLLAHEMGHVVSGHALYRTIAELFVNVSLGALPFLAGVALLPVRLAILEWARKSELSADRASLLGSQDVMATQQVFMKLAAGLHGSHAAGPMNLDAFMAQAHEYLRGDEGLDVVYRTLNTLALSHPMHTVRAAELQQWVASGAYERILRGEYVRRGEAGDRPLMDDLREATSYYRDEFQEVAGRVVDTARRAASAAGEAFRKAREG